jgi:FkbM family methyltransferase
MKYGVFCWRLGQFQIKRLRIGRTLVNLSIPAGEENAMDYEFRNIFYEDCYGLRKVAGTVNNILDVGGNLGFFSLLARSCFPGARIHTYEPNPNIQNHLSNNTQGLSIEVYPEAIGASDGHVNLNTDKGSLFSTTESSENGKIKQTGLLRAIERMGGTVDLLKLDCEGSEWQFFEDQEVWKRIHRVTMEYHLWAKPGMDVPDMLARLRSYGFRIGHLCEEPRWGILWAAKS